MTRTTATLLTLATLSASLLVGCAVDDSRPSQPRTANPLAPSPTAEENAAKRALQAPSTPLPATGAEFPGRSAEGPAGEAHVLTLQGGGGGAGGGSAGGGGGGGGGVGANNVGVGEGVGGNGAMNGGNGTDVGNNLNLTPAQSSGFSGPSGWNAFGNTTGPTTVYNRDSTSGPLPHVPANPGTIPMTGSVPTPGGDWALDFSWGQGLTVENYPHRPWPETRVTYSNGEVRHNPVYFFDVQEHLNVPQNSGTYKGDMVSSLYEVPWFFVNAAALPVLMVLEPPFSERITNRASADPKYRGYLPQGPVVPVPVPGALRWEYSFLNPDGTVKDQPFGTDSTTQPGAPTSVPATAPGGGM